MRGLTYPPCQAAKRAVHEEQHASARAAKGAAKAANEAAHLERQATAQAAKAEKEAAKSARRQEQEATLAKAAAALQTPAARAVAQQLHAHVLSRGGAMPKDELAHFYASLAPAEVEVIKAAKLVGCARGVASFVQAHAALLRLEAAPDKVDKRLIALGRAGRHSGRDVQVSTCYDLRRRRCC